MDGRSKGKRSGKDYFSVGLLEVDIKSISASPPSSISPSKFVHDKRKQHNIFKNNMC